MMRQPVPAGAILLGFSGPGFVDGDDVLMVAALVCLPGGNDFRGRLAVGFHYDSGTDTLIDDFHIIWSRAG